MLTVQTHSKNIIVKEFEGELKKILRQQPIHKKELYSNVVSFEEKTLKSFYILLVINTNKKPSVQIRWFF